MGREYGTTKYEHPQIPSSYKLCWVSDAPEPKGWHGTYRVAVAERIGSMQPDTAYAVWHVRPDGFCFDGIYDLSGHDAEEIAAERAWAEDCRALPINEQARKAV
jgi:hypothetical protein